MAFTPNRRGIAALRREPELNRHLGAIATAGAAAVAATAPSIVKHAGARIYGEVRGGEGRIVIASPFWHLPEYGALRYPQRLYIRPTVARLLSRFGGRFVGR